MSPVLTNDTDLPPVCINMVLLALVSITDDDGQPHATLDRLAGKFQGRRNQVVKAVGKLVYRKLAYFKGRGLYGVTSKGMDVVESGVPLTSGSDIGKHHAPLATDTTTLRARLWRSMHINRRFTIPDVVQIAANETDKDPERSCRVFCDYLRRAGFIIRLAHKQKTAFDAPTSNGRTVYYLKDGFGKLPPRVRRAKDGTPGMYDPNTRQYVPFCDPDIQVQNPEGVTS